MTILKSECLFIKTHNKQSKESHKLGNDVYILSTNKRLISKIYQELLQINKKRQTNQLKNGPKLQTSISQKRKDKWPKSTYIKTFPIPLIISKIIKPIMRCYFTPTRLAKISLTTSSTREDVKQEKVSYPDSGNINWKGKHIFWNCLIKLNTHILYNPAILVPCLDPRECW